jgi:methyl-accepting chemotaxis protein
MNEIVAGVNATSDGAEEAARTAEELLVLAHQLNDDAGRFRMNSQASNIHVIGRRLAA